MIDVDCHSVHAEVSGWLHLRGAKLLVLSRQAIRIRAAGYGNFIFRRSSLWIPGKFVSSRYQLR